MRTVRTLPSRPFPSTTPGFRTQQQRHTSIATMLAYFNLQSLLLSRRAARCVVPGSQPPDPKRTTWEDTPVSVPRNWTSLAVSGIPTTQFITRHIPFLPGGCRGKTWWSESRKIGRQRLRMCGGSGLCERAMALHTRLTFFVDAAPNMDVLLGLIGGERLSKRTTSSSHHLSSCHLS